ncbi:MAG: histidine kinase [Bacteroidia bacterium]
MFRFVVCAFLVICSCFRARAADVYAKNYTVADGLPSNNVYFITSDNHGYLWFCTDLGLSKYDGHRFINYGIDQGLLDEEVFRLLPDSIGRYWMLNHSGQLTFLKDDNIALIKSNLKPTVFRSLAIGENNEVHLSYYNNLLTIKGQSFEQKRFNQDFELVWFYQGQLYGAGDFAYWNLNTGEKIDRLGFEGNFSNRISTKGDLVSISEGLQVVLISGVEKIDSLEIDSKYGEIIYTRPINRNQIWLGTRNGVLIYDFEAKAIIEYFLPGLSITSITADFEGNTWFSSLEQGVFKWPNSKVKTIRFDNEFGAKSRSLLTDSENRIWVGLLGEKYGIIEKDNTTTLGNIDFTNEGIIRIREYDNTVWLVTKKFAINSVTGDKMDNYLNDIYVSNDINLLLTSQVLSFNNQEFKSILNEVRPLYRTFKLKAHNKLIETKGRCVLRKNKNHLYIGTVNGLYSYSLASKATQKLFAEKITSAVLNIVKQDKDTIVVSTQGNGLFWIVNDQIVNRLDKKTGLPSSNIRSTHIDSFGRLWLNSSNQLFMVANQKASPINISNRIGLIKHTIESITSRANTIYLATEQGVVYFDYPSIGKERKPLLTLNEVKLNDEPLLNPQNSFSYNQNKLSFNVLGTSYLSEKDLQYNYKLVPVHDKWLTTFSDEIEFNALKPGVYTFIVKAETANGYASDQISFEFEISEAFYNKWWFQLILLVLVSLVIIIVFRWRVNRINKRHSLEKQQIEIQGEKERIERKLAVLQERALRNQMNPHFVFNALNTIKGFYAENDVTRAGNYLQKFSRLLRVMLTVDQGTIKLEKELELISLYCELMQIRHDFHFNFHIDLDEDLELEEHVIPAMLVQPFVENAIIHGLVPKKESGTVTISVTENNDILNLIIEDNGVGRSIKSNSTHTSRATEITKERLMLLEKLNKTKAQINITDLIENNQPKGTKVVIEIPVVYEI